jgi:hypothetical protein
MFIMQRFNLGLALGLLGFLLGTTPAKADFIFSVGTDASDKVFFDKADGVTTFTGTTQTSNVVINYTTDQAVNVANGYSTVKPTGATFLDLTATPTTGANFTDFSTRGQLQAAGSVTMIVTDQNNQTFSHTFTGLPANADFSPLEATAVTGSGETIKSVEIMSAGWKEVKQQNFGFSTDPAVPEPGSIILATTGLAVMGAFGVVRRRARTQLA